MGEMPRLDGAEGVLSSECIKFLPGAEGVPATLNIHLLLNQVIIPFGRIAVNQFTKKSGKEEE